MQSGNLTGGSKADILPASSLSHCMVAHSNIYQTSSPKKIPPQALSIKEGTQDFVKQFLRYLLSFRHQNSIFRAFSKLKTVEC